MAKSDRELIEEWDKRVKALRLRWKENEQAKECNDGFIELPLNELIKQNEQDEMREKLIFEYEQSVIRYELEKTEFNRGQVAMIKAILWINYQIDYDYEVGKPENKKKEIKG